jgi:hypothetical protein
VLHLAELLAQLVGQHRLPVLPDLLETGRLYCELTRPRLTELVASLEPKVRQLAQVLSLETPPPTDYAQLLVKAHESMARLAEGVVTPASGPANDRNERLASQATADPRKTRPPTGTVSLQAVQAAVARFLEQPQAASSATPSSPGTDGRSVRETWSREDIAPLTDGAALPFNKNQLADFDVRLTLALGQCRAARQPLSVVAYGVHAAEPLAPEQLQAVDRLLEAACRAAASPSEPIAAPAEGRRLVVLVGRDRQDAIAVARGVIDRLFQRLAPLHRAKQLAPCTVAGGVASVIEPAKNFRHERLLETADRCLTAALAGGGVKSLEVI